MCVVRSTEFASTQTYLERLFESLYHTISDQSVVIVPPICQPDKILFSAGLLCLDMKWQHRRDRTKAQCKKEEPKAGISSSFVVAALIAA